MNLAPGFVLERTAPPPDAFISMRAACGWGTLTPDVAASALAGGFLSVTVRRGDDIAGFGRIIGDGAVYFYVQDIVVAPEFQGLGLGRAIVLDLLQALQGYIQSEVYLGLMAAQAKEGFYAGLGFAQRPGAGMGAGMSMTVQPLRG